MTTYTHGIMEVSSQAVPFLPDGDSFHDSLYCENCQCFLRYPCWQHAVVVEDAFSRPLAIASLPDVLSFHNENALHNVGHSLESRTQATIPSVVARTNILTQTVFGPLIAPLGSPTGAHSRTFSSSDGQCVTFDVENDRWCNWMKFVRAVDHGQHNLCVFIRERKVLFVTVKVILPGEELKLALPQRDWRTIHDTNVQCAPMDCVIDGAVDSDDICTAECEGTAEITSLDIPLSLPASCFSASVQPVPYDPLLLLPQSQPLPLESHEHNLSATQLSLRPFQREESPEYPFPPALSPRAPPVDAFKENVALQQKKTDEVAERVLSKEFSPRVYSFRSRNVQRVSIASNGADAFDGEADEDFHVPSDDSLSSSASDGCSEFEAGLAGTAENKAKGLLSKRRTGYCRSDKFLEARIRQVRAVVAVNPFQYPSGEQRWEAYSAAAALLSADVLSKKSCRSTGRHCEKTRKADCIGSK
ncbi:uncharacterized protein LOC129585469 isoform X2 [Paramacrobiotus metropolitanus]|uniref:uncharacterized protein LOC129585469 isoform X2 n=1 Tax=Paramacrobiotus metropolitanus TaxID=2943436 RepID=UPI002445E9D0|nr:uncharacterized protein LOC129585469 isoform X2 [Paramacrobiotus metropolitanus]